MLDTVATCVTTLVIHVTPHFVINLSKYFMASTCKETTSIINIIIESSKKYIQNIMLGR
jgi:hypothetical protein